MCGDGRSARLYAIRAQGIYQSDLFDLDPLERARTEFKLAPRFLVRSALKPRRVVEGVGAFAQVAVIIVT